MAGEKHLYLVVAGSYASGQTPLQGEMWQFGVRLLFKPGTGPDPIGPLTDSWDVVAATIQRTETNWTISSNWTTEGGVSDLDPGDYLNDQAAPAVAEFIDNSFIAGPVQVDRLMLYPIGAPDGKVIPAPPYLQGSPATLAWTSANPVGTGTGAFLPPNNSVVVSTRTAQVGRRGRGRFYLPISPASVIGNGAEGGTVTGTTRTAIATAAKTFLEALQINGGGGAAIWINPIVTGAPYTDYALINSVRVGSVVDSQQRRRRSITEVYTPANVTNPV